MVKTFDGVRSKNIQRPIERLYPIEVHSSVPVSAEEANGVISPCNDEHLSPGVVERPRRVAADNGILLRRLAED